MRGEAEACRGDESRAGMKYSEAQRGEEPCAAERRPRAEKPRLAEATERLWLD